MTNGFSSPRSSLLGLLLRRFPLVLAFAILGALAGAALSGSGSSGAAEYESRALVVATTWELRIEGLPRMVETVVQTNGFREELQRSDADAFAGSADFDQAVVIVPVQDTVAVWLEARANTPELAQRRANLAGDVLVGELNRLGPDIGTFVVQDRAFLPVARVEAELATPLMIALGALGGLTIGTGIAVAWPDRERTSPQSIPRPANETERDAESETSPSHRLALAVHNADMTELSEPNVEPAEDPAWSAQLAKEFGPPRHRSGRGTNTREGNHPRSAGGLDQTG